MDKFKGKPGAAKVYPITDENYLKVTGKEKAYCKIDSKGNETLYAVCPACDNPIQIIGLFRNTSEAGRKPYGRHNKGSIPNLAKYHRGDYLDCPYSNPKWKKPGKYRNPDSPVALRTLELLKTQFDRVIYLLSKDIEVRISLDVAKRMLKVYIANEGWRYRTATLYNLPWNFGEVEMALPLFGKKIAMSGGLHQAIQEHCPEVALEPDESGKWAKVKSANGQYVNLHYVFYKHVFERRTGEDDAFDESITFWVYKGQPPDHTTVYEKKIIIDVEHFQNLINYEPENGSRNEKLLAIANEMIP